LWREAGETRAVPTDRRAALGLGGGAIVAVEENGCQHLAYVPFEVIGEQAQGEIILGDGAGEVLGMAPAIRPRSVGSVIRLVP
jgi:hypothetical protein